MFFVGHICFLFFICQKMTFKQNTWHLNKHLTFEANLTYFQVRSSEIKWDQVRWIKWDESSEIKWDQSSEIKWDQVILNQVIRNQVNKIKWDPI